MPNSKEAPGSVHWNVVNSTNHESRERILVDRIVPIDTGKTSGLEVILKMFQDPANRGHLADITEQTTVEDLIAYYGEQGRHGFVGLSRQHGLVGVYDLSGPEIEIEPLIDIQRIGGQDVKSTFGSLNRLCVRSDLQRRGVGFHLASDGVRRGHNDYGWSTLYAGIVLDEKTSKAIQSARGDTSVEEEVLNRLRQSDARVRLFIEKLGFVKATFSPNVTVGQDYREVLHIVHIRPDLSMPSQQIAK